MRKYGKPPALDRRMCCKVLVRCGERWAEIHCREAAWTPSFDSMVHRATVPPDGVPGFHQLDARRVSAARPAFRDRVPRPDGGLADGWETADRAPVYRLQKLSAPDPRRPALVHPGLPQNLCPPGGARALIRDGPGQSQSVDPRPVASVARGAARPR